jgi:tripartite motif-containing protein 9/67
MLHARKSRLIEAARQTREARVRLLRDQVSRCAGHLQTTTGLLTFCIEALKETDSAAFLQIGGMLSMRAATAAGSWGAAEGVQEMARLPLLDLTLDDKPVRRAVDQLTFVQMKRKCSNSCGQYPPLPSFLTFAHLTAVVLI